MGSLTNIAFPFSRCKEHKTKIGFLPRHFPSAVLFYSFLLSFLYCNTTEICWTRKGRRERQSASSLSLKELISFLLSRRDQVLERYSGCLFCLCRAHGPTIQCMTEPNYPDNYCYLHCPTVVFYNQKLYWQVWAWACWKLREGLPTQSTLIAASGPVLLGFNVSTVLGDQEDTRARWPTHGHQSSDWNNSAGLGTLQSRTVSRQFQKTSLPFKNLYSK